MTNENFGPNQFRGVIKRQSFRYRQPPFFKADPFVLGKSGKYFSQVNFWIHEPSMEFPTYGIYLSLKNAAGSVFTKLTIEELTGFTQQLIEWTSQAQTLIPVLQQKEKEFESAGKAAQKTLEFIQKLKEQGGIDLNTGELEGSNDPDQDYE